MTAIIGVLASISVSQYQAYVSKSKTSEAKLQLASAYNLLKAYHSEYDCYTSCLNQIGFTPEGAKRFYSFGFDSAVITPDVCGPQGIASCAGYLWGPGGVVQTSCAAMTGYFIQANIGINNGFAACPIAVSGQIANSAIGIDTFQVAADGCISKIPTTDRWHIDQSKRLRNSRVGY